MKPSYNSMKLQKIHYRWLQNLYFQIYISWYPLYLSYWVPWGNKEPVFKKLYQQNWLLWSLYKWYCKVSYFFFHFSFIPQRISNLNPHLGPNLDSWHLESCHFRHPTKWIYDLPNSFTFGCFLTYMRLHHT